MCTQYAQHLRCGLLTLRLTYQRWYAQGVKLPKLKTSVRTLVTKFSNLKWTEAVKVNLEAIPKTGCLGIEPGYMRMVVPTLVELLNSGISTI